MPFSPNHQFYVSSFLPGYAHCRFYPDDLIVRQSNITGGISDLGFIGAFNSEFPSPYEFYRNKWDQTTEFRTPTDYYSDLSCFPQNLLFLSTDLELDWVVEKYTVLNNEPEVELTDKQEIAVKVKGLSIPVLEDLTVKYYPGYFESIMHLKNREDLEDRLRGRIDRYFIHKDNLGRNRYTTTPQTSPIEAEIAGVDFTYITSQEPVGFASNEYRADHWTAGSPMGRLLDVAISLSEE